MTSHSNPNSILEALSPAFSLLLCTLVRANVATNVDLRCVKRVRLDDCSGAASSRPRCHTKTRTRASRQMGTCSKPYRDPARHWIKSGTDESHDSGVSQASRLLLIYLIRNASITCDKDMTSRLWVRLSILLPLIAVVSLPLEYFFVCHQCSFY